MGSKTGKKFLDVFFLEETLPELLDLLLGEEHEEEEGVDVGGVGLAPEQVRTTFLSSPGVLETSSMGPPCNGFLKLEYVSPQRKKKCGVVPGYDTRRQGFGKSLDESAPAPAPTITTPLFRADVSIKFSCFGNGHVGPDNNRFQGVVLPREELC